MSRDHEADCESCGRLQTTIDRLALELARERAAHRRTADDLDWSLERGRVLERLIARLANQPENQEQP